MDHLPLLLEMCRYEKGCVAHINHFLKVHSFARAIGLGEGYSGETMDVLETAALVHDIGVKPSLEKYGSADGNYQEQEGPAVAREMLEKLGYPEALIGRVCCLVGRHHTYDGIDGPDCQALIEADFLVNLFEGSSSRAAVEEVREKIFRTATGEKLLELLYLH